MRLMDVMYHFVSTVFLVVHIWPSQSSKLMTLEDRCGCNVLASRIYNALGSMVTLLFHILRIV